MTKTDPAAAAAAPAKQPEPTGILARAKQSAAGRVREGGERFVFSIRDEVAELLTGSPFEPDSYLQAVVRDVAKSKLLQAAAAQAPETVLGAVMLGATLQLPIGGPLGQFYLTPRNEGYGDNRRAVCVPMIGYRGFFELGYRSGRIRAFDYIIVRDGDTFRQGGTSERGKFYDWEQFAHGEFDENDEAGNRRELRGVIALAHPLASERPAWQYMSRSTIERRRPTHTKNTPWEGPHAEAMYVKTPHRELAKFLQLSIQTAKAVEADETISLWNRVTGTLDTLPPDQGILEAGGTAQEPHENAPGSDENAPQGRDAAPADSDAAGAPLLDPRNPADLPAIARAQNREMTEAEFERFSSWEAENAGAGQ